MGKRFFIGCLMAAAVFLLSLSRLDQARQTQGLQRLEDTVRRTAVTCYACEGFYPPDVEYMEENWGLQYDHDCYVVRYEVFASNLMPQITVLEK